MLESKENLQNNNNQPKDDKFTSSFIMVMMIIFISGSVFRKFYNDSPLFKIGWTKYSVADCKKYVAYVEDSTSLSKEMKFQRNFYEIIRIAQQKVAITYLCKKLGLKISNYDVKKSIKNDYRFLENNKFSRQKFLNFLQNSMVSETEYYELKKEELLHEQFWFLMKNSYFLHEKLVKNFNSAYFANRSIRYAVVNHEDIALNYSQKNLRAFYEKNKERFKSYRQYTYEGFKIKTKYFAQEDFTFLNRVIQNNNFESIIKNYPRYTTRVSHEELISLFKDSLDYHADIMNAEKGNCFYCGSDGRFDYVVKVIDIKPAKQLSFKEVEGIVKKIYEQENKPLNINKKELKWKTIVLSADNFYKSELPYEIAKKIFSLSLNNVQVIHANGVSYFIIVDKISSANVNTNHIYLKDFIDHEIFKSVSEYLLSFVEKV